MSGPIRWPEKVPWTLAESLLLCFLLLTSHNEPQGRILLRMVCSRGATLLVASFQHFHDSVPLLICSHSDIACRPTPTSCPRLLNDAIPSAMNHQDLFVCLLRSTVTRNCPPTAGKPSITSTYPNRTCVWVSLYHPDDCLTLFQRSPPRTMEPCTLYRIRV